MSPARQELDEQIRRLSSLNIEEATRYPHTTVVVELANLTQQTINDEPTVLRDELLAKLLENQNINSLAQHMDPRYPKMGLMSYISGDLLSLVRYSLRQLTDVLTEKEKQLLLPMKSKLNNSNEPQGILAITQAAQLLIPQLFQTSTESSPSTTDVADGSEELYHFDYRIIESDPGFIQKLITIAQS